MSQLQVTNIHVCSTVNAVPIPARYNMFNIATSQNRNVRDCMSSLVTLPNRDKYILLRSTDNVGFFTTNIDAEYMSERMMSFTAFGRATSLSRIELIALRTSLLQSFRSDRVVIHTEPTGLIAMYKGVIMQNTDLSTVDLTEDCILDTIDVLDECISVVGLRSAMGKSTDINDVKLQSTDSPVSDMIGANVDSVNGNTDWVLWDEPEPRAASTIIRLKESIKQLGLTSDFHMIYN